MPRYGNVNNELFASWFQREEPGGPMWALNLMKYRDKADYVDGRDTDLTGAEADEVYAPVEHLAAVGSRVILVAPVVHHLAGDAWHWDRIAIAQYRDRMAIVEMNSKEAFQEDEKHKEAGMDFTIVMATFPVEDQPVPEQVSGATSDLLLLLQVVGDTNDADLAEDIDSVHVGRFWIEGRMIGDDRSFAQARFDLISPATAASLVARGYRDDATGYALIADPRLDDVAHSLTDPTKVLF